MAKEQAIFKEIGQLQVSPATAIVVSQVIVGAVGSGEVKGFNINTFVVSEHFTGYTKGVFIPVDKLEEFGDMIKNVLVQ